MSRVDDINLLFNTNEHQDLLNCLKQNYIAEEQEAVKEVEQFIGQYSEGNIKFYTYMLD
jgi:hypothetical protein